MSARKITIDHNGTTYYGHLARIDSTAFGTEDHGIVTAFLHCSWKGGGISVGGYGLDTPAKDENDRFLKREGTGYGLDHLMAIMAVVGVDRWEKIPGREVIVLFEQESHLGYTAKGIASLLDDRVLIFAEHADEWKEAHK